MSIVKRTVNVTGFSADDFKAAMDEGAITKSIPRLEGVWAELAAEFEDGPGWDQRAVAEGLVFKRAGRHVEQRVTTTAQGDGVSITFESDWKPLAKLMVPLAYVVGVMACIVGVFVVILRVKGIKVAHDQMAENFIEAVKIWAGPHNATEEQEMVIE